jgi:hypothetical protein
MTSILEKLFQLATDLSPAPQSSIATQPAVFRRTVLHSRLDSWWMRRQGYQQDSQFKPYQRLSLSTDIAQSRYSLLGEVNFSVLYVDCHLPPAFATMFA